ncbi:unnamed protein product [Withania somnifera]
MGEKSVKDQDLRKVVKLGRRDMNPLLLDELAAEFQRPQDEDLEVDELDEGKKHENNGDDESDGVGECRCTAGLA